MPSLASLVSLGGGRVGVVGTSSSCETTPSYSVVRRVSLSYRRVGFSDRRRWRGASSSIRRYSVTTIAEQSNAVALDSSNVGNAFSGGGSNDSGNASDSEIVLKPAPRPVLKPKGESASGVNSESFSNGSVNSAEKLEERNKVLESLGEVLEKAEKLETSRPAGLVSRKPGVGANVNEIKPPSTNDHTKDANDSADNAKTRKTKTLKSVWRKGDSVGSVQKVIRDAPSRSITGGQESEKGAPLTSPRPPAKPEPKLQQRPSVAPPPALKKPVILKDRGASPKSLAAGEDGSAERSKERKPILIDKFASKKPVVDPLISQAVISPKKVGKVLAPAKFRDDYRKKGSAAARRNASDGARRRMVNDDDVEIEETSELNVAIPGARKGRKWSKASRKAARLKAAQDAAPVKVELLEVGEKGMQLEELAYNLAIDEGEILGFLYTKGIKPDGVQTLNKDLVKMICKEYEVEVLDADPVKVEEMARKKEILDEDDLENLEDRPPVLTIMGHVDHGKTTLLDYIRKSKVAASEAGGITQGIGAHMVLVPVDGKLEPCVFLDTPGHEAFGAMRARGARVTDIAVIVVAADDGIRPQTSEAIAHAKAAGVPIIIAINKIDKDGANPERVMQELSSIGLMPEDWGGDTPMVQISALKGENIDDLLETIMLVAELLELKANPNRNAKGTVIEAGLEKSKGPLATFIVQNGTLKRGDIVVCGEAYGKVRALFDDGGKQVDKAGPSIPVQVIGLNNVPIAGDEFEVVDSLDVARERAEARAEMLRLERITAKAGDGMVTLSSLASAVSSGKISGLDLHQLNIILKVDVQGSIEAVRQALQVLPQDNVTLKFLLQAAGDVTASDVDLAIASKAIILGFNVRAPGSVKSYAENQGVEIRLYKIIYELIDDVRNAMEGLLEPVEEQETIGSAEVRAVFSSGSGRVAGCMVNEGKVVKGRGVRVIRNRKIVHTGILDSLKRVKEAVDEVGAGLECGIGIKEFDDFEEGDTIEAFNTINKRRTLEEASASMAAVLQGVKNELDKPAEREKIKA